MLDMLIFFYFQWNLWKTPKSWRGLLVKVQFKCEDTPGPNIAATEHCVVVKYTGTFEGKNYPTKSSNNENNICKCVAVCI